MAETLYPGSRHKLPIRKPDFPFDASIPKHWAKNNAFATHDANGLQLMFPSGERFFIRSVMAYADRVTDPELRRQVKEFAGQEAMHTREHERFNEVLEAQGYRIRRFLGFAERHMRWVSRRFPKSVCIAMTAGAEHYTALFGTLMLTEPAMREGLHPVMERLYVWHACEEVEHKAVAFDVMQAAGIGYGTRVLGYALVSLLLFGWWFAGSRMLLRQDGISFRQARALMRELPEYNDKRIQRRIVAGIRAYLRRDFHPNQEDVLDVARRELAAVGVG